MVITIQLKTKDLDSKVVAVVDIGAEKTNIAIFNKGVIIKEKIFSFGGIDIDNDISFTYKTELEQSKLIKENFAVCNRKYADSEEIYECINRLGEKVIINQYRLAEMIESRIVGYY